MPRITRNVRMLVKIALAVTAVLVVGWLLVLSLLIGFSSLLFGGNPFDPNPFDDLPFQSVLWRQGAGDRGGMPMGHMAQDVLEHRVRVGMSTEEVSSLLGPGMGGAGRGLYRIDALFRPQNTIYHSTLTPSDQRRAVFVIAFYLGEDLNMAHSIDRADLHLYFDAEQRYLGGQIGWY